MAFRRSPKDFCNTEKHLGTYLLENQRLCSSSLRCVVYNPVCTHSMYNMALQIHSGKQRRRVTFIGCGQTELALYNLGSHSLGTHCNISLFSSLTCLLRACTNSETLVLAAAAARFVWFWFGGL